MAECLQMTHPQLNRSVMATLREMGSKENLSHFLRNADDSVPVFSQADTPYLPLIYGANLLLYLLPDVEFLPSLGTFAIVYAIDEP